MNSVLLPVLDASVNELVKSFGQITPGRKRILNQLTEFVQSRISDAQEVNLNFICTHNSRRSHIAQLWAQASAHYYGIPGVKSFSGGTEATEFNTRAITAMQLAGFSIAKIKAGENPRYEVRYSDYFATLVAFSKKYDDPVNESPDFAAVMTCSHADENCPLVSGASVRIALTYDDPKQFDGTPEESARYSERVNEIGREILFAFSKVRI